MLNNILKDIKIIDSLCDEVEEGWNFNIVLKKEYIYKLKNNEYIFSDTLNISTEGTAIKLDILDGYKIPFETRNHIEKNSVGKIDINAFYMDAWSEEDIEEVINYDLLALKLDCIKTIFKFLETGKY